MSNVCTTSTHRKASSTSNSPHRRLWVPTFTCEEKLIAVLSSTGGIDATLCQWCASPRPEEWDKSGAGGSVEGGHRKTDVHDDGGMHCSDTLCGQFVCRSCLQANLTREQLTLVRIANDDGQWKCFRCDSHLIRGHQMYAATIAEYVRLRRRPVLIPTAAATSWSLSADQPPQPQLQPSRGEPPAYGEEQLKIEELGRRARSLVEACALSSVSPAGLTTVTRCLQELVMWAHSFLEPGSVPVFSTQQQTKSADDLTQILTPAAEGECPAEFIPFRSTEQSTITTSAVARTSRSKNHNNGDNKEDDLSNDRTTGANDGDEDSCDSDATVVIPWSPNKTFSKSWKFKVEIKDKSAKEGENGAGSRSASRLHEARAVEDRQVRALRADPEPIGKAAFSVQKPVSSGNGEQAFDVENKSAVIDALHQQEINDLVLDENASQEKCASGKWAEPVNSGHGEQAMDVDNKSAVIDALHQQEPNYLVPGENASQEKCASAVRVEGPDQVAPELDQPMSPPRSPAAAATQAAEPLQPPPEADAIRTSPSLENRLDAAPPAPASTSKVPPPTTVASTNASAGTTNATAPIHDKADPLSADDVTQIPQILTPAVEGECLAEFIPFCSTEQSTITTSAVARTSRSKNHNNGDNKEDDLSNDRTTGANDGDDDEDSCDSDATVVIPWSLNKTFSNQKFKVEIEDKSAKEGENGAGSRSSGLHEARAKEDYDDYHQVRALLADIEPRRRVAFSVQVSDSADNEATTRARQGVKKARTKADKAHEPFASSSDDELEVGEPSQPGDFGPIVVLSDCDGVSDLLSEAGEEDGAVSMRAVAEEDDDNDDDGDTSPPDAHGLRTSEGSAESSPERRRLPRRTSEEIGGRGEDASSSRSREGESVENDDKRCKRPVRKGLPKMPLEHGVTKAAVAEDDDDNDADRCGGYHSKNGGEVDDDNFWSAEGASNDTAPETKGKQRQNEKGTKAKGGRKRCSSKPTPDSPSELNGSAKNQKRLRLESNRSTSEDELELSPLQQNSVATGAAPAANDNKLNSDNNKGVVSRQAEIVLLSSSKSDDDVHPLTPSSDAVNGRTKQTRISKAMPTSKNFAKQIIKEGIDSCVILGDDGGKNSNTSSSSSRSSRRATDKDTHVSPHGHAKLKQEPPTLSRSGTPAGRRNIRGVMREIRLSQGTREANAAERERRQRIDELQKKYNQFARRIEASGSDGAKCVLEFDLKTKQPLVEVHPVLSRRLKSHQRDGVKFLYRNLVETVEQLKKDASRGAGAILGHCMGLGKTFQVVCLIHTFLTHPLLKEHFKTILVICPLNVINAWCSEINQWVLCDNAIVEKFPLYNLHAEKDSCLRISLLAKWTRSGGVLLVTLSLLTALLGAETDAGKRRRQRQEASSIHGAPTSKSLTDSCEFGAASNNRPRHDSGLLGKFKEFLCDPGASVVVVDEGHTLKQGDTQVTQIVQMMQTRRKVLLTGTPLQNDLTEYYTMVSIVSPGLLGTRNEFKNCFENPIMNGQYKNSTLEDIRNMRRRASVLNKLLGTVVQRRDLSVLASILPPRQDYVLTIRLSPLQERLYEEFLGMLIARAEEQATNSRPSFRRLLQDYALLRSTWTHPKLLTMPPKTHPRKQQVVTVSNVVTLDKITPEQDNGIAAQRDWYKPHLEGKDLDDIALGPKLFILFDIIEQCALIGDKLVVFCSQLSAIDLIEYLLRLMHENHIGMRHGWVKETDYFRMDGSTTAEDRQKYFEMFNDPDRQRARLFLVSTKAGKLGSTLIGANRMVLLDTSWNPADDNQAVYRIYRIGQVKPVYIYRFVSLGTMEEKMYARNILKECTGYRVLDNSNMERHFTHEDVRNLYKFTRYKDTEKVIPHVPKDCLLAELILRHKENIVKVHEHQQMLQNLEDDLSEEDRRLAWEEYQREKDARSGADTTAPAACDASLRTPPKLYVAEQLVARLGGSVHGHVQRFDNERSDQARHSPPTRSLRRR